MRRVLCLLKSESLAGAFLCLIGQRSSCPVAHYFSNLNSFAGGKLQMNYLELNDQTFSELLFIVMMP
jgi:hypothetical protein